MLIDGTRLLFNARSYAGFDPDGNPNMGGNVDQAAANLVLAINTNPRLSRNFLATVAGNTITLISKKGAVAAVVTTPYPPSPPGTGLNTTINSCVMAVSADMPVAKWTTTVGGIDVSGITDIDGFIGSLKQPTFTVTNQAITNGDAAAVNLFTQLTGKAPARVNGNGDSTIAMTATIAGRSFQAMIFKSAGCYLDAGTVIKFTEQGTGQSFNVTTTGKNWSIDGAGGWNVNFATKETAQAEIGVDLTNLFTNAVFAQTRDLTINTDGDIVVDGASVGSVEGMTVSLNSTSFNDKKFEGFTVASGTTSGVKLTATISGVQFVVDNVLPVGLVKGAAVTLTSTDGSGDTLTINLGEKGLATVLSRVTNYAAVSKSITEALTSSGAGLDVRVGLSLDDQLKVQIPDVSPTRLYRDNAGNFHANLSVLDKAGITTANECVKNALAVVRAAQASIQGHSETVEAASTSLSSALSITKDASDGYLDADLVQVASAFAAALKSILAAISTLQAEARIADAGLEIIKVAAQ